MKCIPYTVKNKFGYWVGCIKYGNGTKSEITNAQYSEAKALAIVTRIAERQNNKS